MAVAAQAKYTRMPRQRDWVLCSFPCFCRLAMGLFSLCDLRDGGTAGRNFRSIETLTAKKARNCTPICIYFSVAIQMGMGFVLMIMCKYIFRKRGLIYLRMSTMVNKDRNRRNMMGTGVSKASLITAEDKSIHHASEYYILNNRFQVFSSRKSLMEMYGY